MVNGIEAAFTPTLSPSFRTIDVSNIHKPEATMPFIKALADRFGFDIQEEWNSFMGISEKKTAKTVKQKFEFYVSEAETTLNISRIQFLARNRKREYVFIRHMIAFICVENKLGTLKFIGKILGNFDHSTIINSINVVQDLRDSNDIEFMPIYNALIHLVEKK